MCLLSGRQQLSNIVKVLDVLIHSEGTTSWTTIYTKVLSETDARSCNKFEQGPISKEHMKCTDLD